MKTRLNKLAFFLMLLACSCKRQPDEIKVDGSFLIHKWKVLTLTINGVSEGQPPKPYLLDFYTDKNVSLQLDVNGCGALYNLPEIGKIQLTEGFGCTKICCDSKFSTKLLQAISGIDNYTLKNDTLMLVSHGIIGEGQLKLIR